MEEKRAKRMSTFWKREKSFDGGSSKSRLDIKDKPMFKKRSSNNIPTKFTKAREDRVSIAKSQKGRGTRSQVKKPTCEKFRKKHYGDFVVGTDNGFGCGNVSTRLEIL